MQRQVIVGSLAQQGYMEMGTMFYGVVDNYPVIVSVPQQTEVRLVTATVSIQAAPAGAQRKALKQALKGQGAALTVQGKALLIAWKEKKGVAFDDMAAMTAAAVGAIREQGIAEADDTCVVCGRGDCDGYVHKGMRYEPVHQHCVYDLQDQARQQVERNSGSYLLGIVGALVGGLVGIIPTVLSIWFTETIWSLLYALIPLGAYYGYKLCGGKMNKMALITTIVVSIANVYVIQMVLAILDLMVNYGLSLFDSLQLLRAVLGNGEFWAEMTTNSWDSFLFILLGIWIAWSNISRTNKSELKSVEDVVKTMTVKAGAEPLTEAPLETTEAGAPETAE